ncbi:MAG: hypothetical protein QM757_00105 [Paludibaculum sp.]
MLRVGETREFGGKTYFQLIGLREGSFWLRNEADRVLRWNEDSNKDALWYDFSKAAGESYESDRPMTLGTASLERRDALVSTPVGTFPNSITIAYGVTGTRVGDFSASRIARESFAEGVGLLTRDETQFTSGNAQYQLAYARIGGVTVYRGAETGIEVSINDSRTHARLRVDQSIEVVKTLHLFDETGGEIWNASNAGKFFIAVGDLNAALPELKAGKYVITGECGDARISLPFTVE